MWYKRHTRRLTADRLAGTLEALAHTTHHTHRMCGADATQHTAHSTQHTAHSTQHTAHSTQHTLIYSVRRRTLWHPRHTRHLTAAVCWCTLYASTHRPTDRPTDRPTVWRAYHTRHLTASAHPARLEALDHTAHAHHTAQGGLHAASTVGRLALCVVRKPHIALDSAARCWYTGCPA